MKDDFEVFDFELLRTNESPEFTEFIEYVNLKANRLNCFYFLDCVDGNDIEYAGMQVADLCGWLIPIDKVEEFLPVWQSFKEDDTWIEYYTFVEWKRTDDDIEINFVDSQIYQWQK